MTTTTDDLIAESLLAAGATPRVQRDLIDPTEYPSLGSAGYDVAAYGRAAISISFSRNGPRRRYVLTVPTFDAASTYSISLNGGTDTGTSATPADEATMWTALNTTLTSGLSDGITVTTTATSGGQMVIDCLPNQAPLSWTVTGGSPTLALTAEPTECRARVYGRLPSATGGTYVDADEEFAVNGWNLKLTDCGAAHDYDVGADGYLIDHVWCRADAALRVWCTGVTNGAGDVCTDTITVLDPVVIVAPCLLGGT